LLPAVGDVLRCPHCADERPFVKPPLLVVTGTAGIGKSTLCARLAGTIPSAVLLDADIHAEDLISVVSPNQDYPEFWRSMMRLAHELAQNNLVVVYFAAMLPEQIFANRDVLGYFDSVHFLCLTCSADVLRARLARREGTGVINADTGDVVAGIKVWIDFDGALVAAAGEVPTATLLDAGRPIDEVEHDVRHWIDIRLHRT
jgi:gluconate kinase